MESYIQKSLILSKTAKVVTYFSPLTIILFTVFVVSYAIWKRKRARLVECLDKLPGPATTPLIGNALEINVQHDGELKGKVMQFCLGFCFRVRKRKVRKHIE